MTRSTQIVALLCLALHVTFFWTESVAFERAMTTSFRAEGPSRRLQFGLFDPDGVDNVRALQIFAFNMGIYNLCIAVGIGLSLFIQSNRPAEARTLLVFLCGMMFTAGLTLGLSASWLFTFAAAQAGLAAICLASMTGGGSGSSVKEAASANG